MEQEKLLNTILAEVVNVKEYMRESMATKEDLQEVKSSLLSHIDGFIKLHEAISLELVSMRAKTERLEARLERIEMKLGITEAVEV